VTVGHEDIGAPPEPASVRRRAVRIILWLVVVGVVLALLEAVGVDLIGWLGDLLDVMRRIPLPYLIVGLLAHAVNVVLVGFAYVAIWRAAYPAAAAVPVLQIITCYAVGQALSGVLPLGIGTWTMLFMFLAIIPGATAAGIVAGYGVAKIFFFAVGVGTYTFLFIVVSSAVTEQLGGIRANLGAFAVIGVLVLILIVLLLRVFRQRLKDTWANLIAGGAILRHPARWLALVILPQAVGYVFEITASAAFMAGYGIPVTVRTVLLNDAAVSLSGLTAVTPGGVGTMQVLTTAALAGEAPASTVAAFSITHQLILTAGTAVLAIVLVAIAFGWSGGRTIVSNSLVRARAEVREKRSGRRGGDVTPSA
jgi:uncharacterized membrane protein YbhN (UPF0104 family)